MDRLGDGRKDGQTEGWIDGPGQNYISHLGGEKALPYIIFMLSFMV